MVKYQSPVDKSWVTDGHTDGSAADFGWLKKYQNKNQDVFAVGNGEVLWTGYMNDLGNGIVTKHPYNSTHDMWVGMGHFLKLPIVKKGDKVKQGQKIANMGKSGISRGEHVHVRMSLVPKNTRFSWANFNKEPRLDPVKYLYEYPHQLVEGLQKLPADKPKEETNKKLTDKEIAHQILYGDNIWGDGQARKDSLGSRWRSVQNIIEAELAKNNKPKPPVQKPTPSKPKFKSYSYTIPKGSTLYGANGTAYDLKTSNDHKVTIISEKNGMGNFKASWLKGVNNAWVKLGKQGSAKLVFKPYKKTIPRGATLYNANGTAHDIKTSNAHTVTITKENNGLGNFKASWLKGVSNAWVKL